MDRMQRGMDIVSIFIGIMGFLGAVLIRPKKNEVIKVQNSEYVSDYKVE